MKNIILLVSFICSIIISGCIKDQYDAPPAPTNPNITANYTIEQLKNAYTTSGKPYLSVTENYIVEAIVTANDASGNFYKEIVVQDNTAAIGIKIDRASLYNDFPIGRKVFINLKGMAVGNYNNLIQLGGYIDSLTTPGSYSLGAIPSVSINNFLIKGSIGNTVEPTDVSISGLNTSMQYKLIRLTNVEFDCKYYNTTYADAVNQSDVTKTLNDCNGKSVFVRNSGYANFAGDTMPKGNGTMVAIYQVYRTDNQLKLRDPSDLNMSKTRCVSCTGTGGGGGGGSTTATKISIQDLRSQFTGNGAKIDKLYIEGVVISNYTTLNINANNLVIQDGTGGILVRFRGAHSFPVGEKLKIEFKGDSLIKYKGLMEMDWVPNSSVTDLGVGTVTPITVTLATINNAINTYESTLVKIVGAKITGGTTYAGSRTVSDATANITLYTLNGATFANDVIPTGTVSVTGIISLFNTTKQIQIRSTADIQ